MSIWADKTILITGGTGSFGKAFIKQALTILRPKKIIVFSRDELKQSEMAAEINDPRVRFFIGDVRDRERIRRALNGVNIVIHAAAMKRVESCEYNPFEAVQTNVIGTQNVVNEAIDAKVSHVIALSTDKAVNPVNLYGATKLCLEKLVIQGNAYVGAAKNTRLSCVRYGNVVGSRGSVVPLFKKQAETGQFTITDTRMTRFWITLEQAVDFVISSGNQMLGGEIFVPKLPSMKITDLAEALNPAASTVTVGIRPGEKLHECMLTEDESRHTFDVGDRYVVLSEFPFSNPVPPSGSSPVRDSFRYDSGNNTVWLTANQLREMMK